MTDHIERLQDPEAIRLHMGELTASAMRVAQAAIRYALAGVQGERGGWLPIELAPKGCADAIEVIILGYAPDEESYSPPSREGFWSWAAREWRFTSDPTWKGPPQPTHWMPLPQPPKENGDE